MEFDLRLFFSGVAIFLSCISLFISFKNSNYVKKTKDLELKNSLLSKYYEVKQLVIELIEKGIKMRSKATKENDLYLYKIFDYEESMNVILGKIEHQHKEIKAMPSSISLRLYEETYHEIHEIAEDVKVLKNKRETELKKHEEKKR